MGNGILRKKTSKFTKNMELFFFLLLTEDNTLGAQGVSRNVLCI